jgi:dihydroorotate dehydrogenase
VEVGGIPEHPQKGNVKPRQWVVAPGVIVNALGFNSPGEEKVARNLARYEGSGIPIGIQVTANKNVVESEDPQDHIRAFTAVIRRFYSIASWFTLGVSSPNTVRMRERYQGREWLALIVSACIETMEEMGGRRPLFIKISPDLTQIALDEVIEVAMEYGAGIVASNTTVNIDIKAKYGWGDRPGGLSGDDADFRALSTRQIAYIYTQTMGMVPIMGAGGVKDCPTALEKFKAGALPLAIVSAIPGRGPTVFGRINRDLVDYVDGEGIHSIQDIVGIEAHKYH